MKARPFLLEAVFLAFSVFFVLAMTCDDDDDDSGGGDGNVPGDLIWQDPPSDGRMTWEDAIAYCENLSFDGNDDWRLPTISELRSLIRGCEATELGGACGVTDDCTGYYCANPDESDACYGCGDYGGSGPGQLYWPDGMSGWHSPYWSSSRLADFDGEAWCVNFVRGAVNDHFVDEDNAVRCVRP